MPKLFDLERFLSAQDPVYDTVIAELRNGRKQSHWMWFIFPQLKGLGHSAMAQHYGIGSLAEALAYLGHPVLGPRLRECTEVVVQLTDSPVEKIFGYPDDLKFHSSMTLFAQAAPQPSVFAAALDKYFASAPDPLTLERLELQSDR